MMLVPSGQPASSTALGTPPSKWSFAPLSAPRSREKMSSRETEEIAASASPRKPSVPIASRSSAVRSLLVAWRKKAVGAYLLERPSGVVVGLKDLQTAMAEAQQTSGEPDAAQEQPVQYTDLPLDAEGYPVE